MGNTGPITIDDIDFSDVERHQRERDEREAKRWRHIMRRFVFPAITVLALLGFILGYFFGYMPFHKWGDGLWWKYDSSTKALTISGRGELGKGQRQGVRWLWEKSPSSDEVATVVIKDGCTKIGDAAFLSFVRLTSVSIPKSVTAIGGHAFYGCERLESIELPSGLTSIGPQAFGATGITQLRIPSSVSWIDRSSGGIGGGSLIRFIVDEDNPWFTSVGGVLFNDDVSELLEYPSGRNATEYSVPETVRRIGPYAFADSYCIRSVRLPNSVTMIEDYAFSGIELREIQIPSSVTSIGRHAFCDCGSGSVIYYAGYVDQWLSFASGIDFKGTVECRDGSFTR